MSTSWITENKDLSSTNNFPFNDSPSTKSKKEEDPKLIPEGLLC